MSAATQRREVFPGDLADVVRLLPGRGLPAIVTRGIPYQSEVSERAGAGKSRVRAIYDQVLVPKADLPPGILRGDGFDEMRVEFDGRTFKLYRVEELLDPRRVGAEAVMLILEPVVDA